MPTATRRWTLPAYVITQPNRYMFELAEGNVARTISEFLIRSYPRDHVGRSGYGLMSPTTALRSAKTRRLSLMSINPLVPPR